MRFNPVTVTKFVATGIVGIGTGKIVGKVIKAHVQPETLIEKVTVTAASWVLSAVMTKATKEYTNEAIDEVVEKVTEVVGKIKQGNKLAKINRGESTFEDEALNPMDYVKDEATGKYKLLDRDNLTFHERDDEDDVANKNPAND